MIDRALYLPESWADDAKRRGKTKVPETVPFATKPHLAQTMLARALDAGMPAAWLTGDSVYGNDRSLRAMLQQRRQPFVVAVKSDLRLPFLGGGMRASTLAARISDADWQTLSCGDGAKGARHYEWARVPLDAPEQPEQTGFLCWLLVRRSLSDPREQAYYGVFAPQHTPLTALVSVAGTRWTIETNFETAKGEGGLDQYEVRFVARLASAQDALPARASISCRAALGESDGAGKKGGDATPQYTEDIQAVSRVILPLSVPEIRHLLGRLQFTPPTEPAHYLLWSLWRRGHQTLAKFYHYKKRGQRMPLLQL